jgi:hypothetical protein
MTEMSAQNDAETQRIIGSLVARVDSLETTLLDVLKTQREILDAVSTARGSVRTVAAGWDAVKWGLGAMVGSAITTIIGFLGGHIKWG